MGGMITSRKVFGKGENDIQPHVYRMLMEYTSEYFRCDISLLEKNGEGSPYGERLVSPNMLRLATEF